jgi:biotin carboxyl carrier protein
MNKWANESMNQWINEPMNNDLRPFVVDDTTYPTNYTKKFLNRKKYVAPDPKKMLAFIPGVILKLHIKAGDRVKRGQSLLILEAMKMKNDVSSPMDGTIKAIHITEGTMVAKNQILLEFD